MGFVDELIENKKIAACVNSEKWFALYKHAPKEPPENREPDNGGAIQPAADINTALQEQRKRFRATKLKILEV